MKLSVLIPTFDRAEHLINCLISIGNQTFPHDKFEILICDDGSKDQTFGVIQEAKRTFDFPIRAWYLDRPERTTACLAWNFLVRKAKAPILVLLGAHMIMAKNALELHYKYQQESEFGNLFVFGRAYRVHSVLAQSLLNSVNWRENFQALEELFISEYHHSQYWEVPYCASIHKKWIDQIHGWDEDWNEIWPDDSDLLVRLKAIGVQSINALDILSAHQFHGEQIDPICGPECKCPLVHLGHTWPGPELEWHGEEKDIIRNQYLWGEFSALEI